MGDYHGHQDMYDEATTRRTRETGAWVRDQTNRRHAQRAAERRPHQGLRVHAIELLAQLLGVADEIATTTKPPGHLTSHRH